MSGIFRSETRLSKTGRYGCSNNHQGRVSDLPGKKLILTSKGFFVGAVPSIYYSFAPDNYKIKVLKHLYPD